MADKSLKWLMEIPKLISLQARLNDLKKPIDRATANEAGDKIKESMLDFISKGKSPIKGEPRFPAYKDKKKYPGKRKGARPVNLKLTGEFLDALTHTLKNVPSGYAPVIFYKGKYDKYESGHRYEQNTQPPRPTIPQKALGEDIAVTITRIVKNIYNARIRELTQRKK